MRTTLISRKKFERLNACADAQGIIAALAVDQRSSLQRSLAKVSAQPVTAETLSTFKAAVARVLSPAASALLIDPDYGAPAIAASAPGTGIMLSYEQTGYDPAVPGRLPSLLPGRSVRRLTELGADAVKVLLYYNPFDDAAINTVKQAFIERVGAECAAEDVPVFLEPLAYDDRHDATSLEFARLKPGYVTAIMQEFSRPAYRVDVLKVEVPINSAFLAGSRAHQGGEAAYDRTAALDEFRAAAVAEKPFIYLSAGVDDDVFREQLELAAEAGVPYSGVLCGRASWKDGIAIFATEGPDALDAWLRERGVRNLQALNAVVAQGAQPWPTVYGGRKQIVVAE
jgi:tagatose 1,6-diphosphate aldolase